MYLIPLTRTHYYCFALAALVLLFALLGDRAFALLSLTRSQINQGELWRLVTGNFVHFDWAHCLMNLAAFLLAAYALLGSLSLLKLNGLLLWCSLVVGAGIYLLNPEYTTYAGLSGLIHGLIIAGLCYSRDHPLWLRGAALGLVIVKIAQEQNPNYQATELQALISVPVAVDAHLYGALAAVVFVLFDILIQKIKQRL